MGRKPGRPSLNDLMAIPESTPAGRPTRSRRAALRGWHAGRSNARGFSIGLDGPGRNAVGYAGDDDDRTCLALECCQPETTRAIFLKEFFDV
jgi:hypothetical protein